jgi:hypothetical protein
LRMLGRLCLHGTRDLPNIARGREPIAARRRSHLAPSVLIMYPSEEIGLSPAKLPIICLRRTTSRGKQMVAAVT